MSQFFQEKTEASDDVFLFSYLTIQTQIQDNLAKVNERNKFVVDEGKRLQVEMERQQQMAKAAKSAEEQLAREKREMEEELETLKRNRDRWMDSAGMSVQYCKTAQLCIPSIKIIYVTQRLMLCASCSFLHLVVGWVD